MEAFSYCTNHKGKIGPQNLIHPEILLHSQKMSNFLNALLRRSESLIKKNKKCKQLTAVFLLQCNKWDFCLSILAHYCERVCEPLAQGDRPEANPQIQALLSCRQLKIQIRVLQPDLFSNIYSDL